LAGQVFLTTRDQITYEIHDVQDGHLNGSITVGSSADSVNLSQDGSYVWTLQAGTLQTWSVSGAPKFTFLGNYQTPDAISATPTRIEVAGGPAGASVIEYLDITNGAQTTSSSFVGTFAGWFSDGSHIFTTQFGKVIRIYTSSAQLAWNANVPSTATYSGQGVGDFFWYDGSSISRIGSDPNTATTVASFFPQTVNGNTVGAFSEGAVRVLHLGATVTEEDGAVPTEFGTFALDSSGQWAVVDNTGALVYRGTSSNPSAQGYLGCGQALAVAGSESGLAAVSTTSGRTLIIDTVSKEVVETISRSFSDSGQSIGGLRTQHLFLSSDGNVLAGNADQTSSAHGIDIFVRPIVSPPIAYPEPQSSVNPVSGTLIPENDFRLSRDGSRLGLSCSNKVTDIFGASLVSLVATPRCSTPHLSPSGVHIAVSDTDPNTDDFLAVPPPQTTLYEGGVIVGAVPGYALGWTDEHHLVVQTYSVPSHHPVGWNYVSTNVYSDQGVLLSSPSGVPRMIDFYAVSSTQILSTWDGNIYDLTSGATVWTNGVGSQYSFAYALAGSSAVQAAGDGVFMASH
jgi:hypothetical protein